MATSKRKRKPELIGSAGSFADLLAPDNERRPVGVGAYGEGGCFVVCNDGSVWKPRYGFADDRVREWDEAPPIPGTRRCNPKTRGVS